MKGENESPLHYQLKVGALVWLHRRGVRTVSFEVPVRTPGFESMKIDVGAYDDASVREVTRGPRGGRKRRILGRRDDLIAIECKAVRSDFLKDSRRIDALERRLRELEESRAQIESNIRRQEPHLFVCETLFPDDGEWKYERSLDPLYSELRKKTARISRHLHRGTKFENLARARLFHRHYLCCPEGLVQRSELPPHWGLLELKPSDSETEIEIVQTAVADRQEVGVGEREGTIRALAKAGTKALVRAAGLAYGNHGLEIGAAEDSPSKDDS